MCGSPQDCECAHHGGQVHRKEECRDQVHEGRHSFGDCGCGQHPAGGCCCSDGGSVKAAGDGAAPSQQV